MCVKSKTAAGTQIVYVVKNNGCVYFSLVRQKCDTNSLTRRFKSTQRTWTLAEDASWFAPFNSPDDLELVVERRSRGLLPDAPAQTNQPVSN